MQKILIKLELIVLMKFHLQLKTCIDNYDIFFKIDSMFISIEIAKVLFIIYINRLNYNEMINILRIRSLISTEWNSKSLILFVKIKRQLSIELFQL